MKLTRLFRIYQIPAFETDIIPRIATSPIG